MSVHACCIWHAAFVCALVLLKSFHHVHSFRCLMRPLLHLKYPDKARIPSFLKDTSFILKLETLKWILVLILLAMFTSEGKYRLTWCLPSLLKQPNHLTLCWSKGQMNYSYILPKIQTLFLKLVRSFFHQNVKCHCFSSPEPTGCST